MMVWTRRLRRAFPVAILLALLGQLSPAMGADYVVYAGTLLDGESDRPKREVSISGKHYTAIGALIDGCGS